MDVCGLSVGWECKVCETSRQSIRTRRIVVLSEMVSLTVRCSRMPVECRSTRSQTLFWDGNDRVGCIDWLLDRLVGWLIDWRIDCIACVDCIAWPSLHGYDWTLCDVWSYSVKLLTVIWVELVVHERLNWSEVDRSHLRTMSHCVESRCTTG